MIRFVKACAVVIILALTSGYSLAADKVVVIPLGGYDGPVCCKVNSDGSLIVEESNRLCNGDSAETGRVLATSMGSYEVDFLSPLTDVRSRVKMVTLDTHGAGSTRGKSAGVANRSFDESSVYVSVNNISGDLADESFNLCLF